MWKIYYRSFYFKKNEIKQITKLIESYEFASNIL